TGPLPPRSSWSEPSACASRLPLTPSRTPGARSKWSTPPTPADAAWSTASATAGGVDRGASEHQLGLHARVDCQPEGDPRQVHVRHGEDLPTRRTAPVGSRDGNLHRSL